MNPLYTFISGHSLYNHLISLTKKNKNNEISALKDTEKTLIKMEEDNKKLKQGI